MMFIKPNEQELSPELKKLQEDAFAVAKAWDGWNARPLTSSQIIQIEYIVNLLIKRAVNKLAGE